MDKRHLNLKKNQGFHTNPERINKNGRPRKLATQLKLQGYKMDEINRTIENLLACTMEELQDVAKNDNATMLERIMSMALYNALKKGTLDNLETLLTRRWASPVQRSELNAQSIIHVTAPDKETKDLIDSL